MVDIQGHCDPRFERVRAAFAKNFAQRNEYGAAVAVYIDGAPVLDLWGGHADRQTDPPLDPRHARQSVLDHQGVHRDLRPSPGRSGVARSRRAGLATGRNSRRRAKTIFRVRQLLNHRAGLPALRRQVPDEAIYDWAAMTAALAAEEPWWTPGTKHGYRAITFVLAGR